MARKKRHLGPVAVAASERKPKARYEDAFQHSVGRKIEDAGKKLEGRGPKLLYALGALVILGVLVWIFYAWSSRSEAAAQAALGKAIETSQAQVADTPPPGSTQKTFKTEKERAQAALAQFQEVASKYGGSVGEKAKYFAATNLLVLDRAAAEQELESLAGNNSPVGKLAKFALAQARADDGKTDEAIALYNELSGLDEPVLSKETIDFELAKLYEKQGKTQEAVDLFYNIVKKASEARDLEGKPVSLSATAENAKEKLKELAPQKAAEIPEPLPDNSSDFPSGG